jgi:hypothetical protein
MHAADFGTISLVLVLSVSLIISVSIGKHDSQRHNVEPCKNNAFADLGVDISCRIIGHSPIRYGCFNASHLLFTIANGSIILGDTDLRVVQSKQVYVTGFTPPSSTPNSDDFVSIDSAMTLVGLDDSQYIFQFVTLLSDGSSGFRIASSDRPDATLTAITNRYPPQFIYGFPSSATVYRNPVATFITPEGPVTPKAIPCVEHIYRASTSSLKILFAPLPDSCSIHVAGVSYTTTVVLSSNVPLGGRCVEYRRIAPAVIPSNLTATGSICFAENACRLENIVAINNTNQSAVTATRIVSSQEIYNVFVLLGCVTNRLFLTCNN